MRKTNTGLKAAACLAVSVLLGGTASAQSTIYDNSTTFLGQRTGEGNAEIGDVVQFAGSDRTLTAISFEYFVAPDNTSQATSALFGNETGQFMIYSVGNNNLPGTLLYTSPTFNLVPGNNGYGRIDIGNISVGVPDRVAWTVSFAGVEGSEQAGLLFYNPPTVGSSPTFDPGDGSQHDFFVKNQTDGWHLLDTPNLVDNLGVRFTAVPEPTTVALLVGGLVTMGLIRRRNS